MIRAHSLRLHKNKLNVESVKLVYFQNITAAIFTSHRDEITDEWAVTISEFSRILAAKYPEVIYSNFSDGVWQTHEPWLVVEEKTSDEKIKHIYREFLGWFIKVVKEEALNFYGLPLEARNGNQLVIQLVSAQKLFSSTIRNAVLPRLYLRQFPELPKQLKWEYEYTAKGKKDKKTEVIIPGKHEEKTFNFPKQWFYTDGEGGAEIVSEAQPLPCLIDFAEYLITKKGLDIDIEVYKKQYFRYVFTIECESENETDEVIFHIKSSVRRMIYSPLYNRELENYFFPRGHKRTLYVEELSSNRLLQFPLNSKDNKAFISMYNETVKLFTELGFDLFPQSVLKNPSYFYQSETRNVFIPYKTDDKRHLNLIESGISKLEKKFIYDMFQGTFPELEQAYESWKLVPLKNPTLLQNIVALGPVISNGPKDMNIEVVSKENLFPYLTDIFVNWGKYEDKQKRNPYVVKKTSKQTYELLDINNTKNVLLKINFIIRKSWLHITEPMNYGKMEKADLEEKRRIEILKLFDKLKEENKKNAQKESTVSEKKAEPISYVLLEIDDYGKNGKLTTENDPYNIIKKTFLENNRIVQCFHPLIHNSNTTNKSILKSSLTDLFARRGITNQMHSIYHDLFSKHVYYFPVLYTKKDKKDKVEYLYIMAKFENGNLTFKYSNTAWMSLEQSIVYLGSQDLQNQWKKGSQEYTTWIESQITEPNSVAVFDNRYLPKGWKFSKLPFNVAVYDVTSEKSPYIEKLDKENMPSAGTFMVKDGRYYYSVPPKLRTSQQLNKLVKLELKDPISHRRTMKLTMIHDDADIAASIHLMRGIPITFDSYVNHPLPLHLLRHHIKELKRLEPSKAALVH